MAYLGAGLINDDVLNNVELAFENILNFGFYNYQSRKIHGICRENTRSNLILVNGGSWRDEVSQHA
jgi:hypothetical protein